VRSSSFHALPRPDELVRGRIANLEPGYVAATVKVNCYLFGRDGTRLEGAVD
jgi:hypothetical protein